MTFINFPASDIGGADDSTGCVSGIGGMGSIGQRAHPLLRQKAAKVTRNVADYFAAQNCPDRRKFRRLE
jgi:hypothetical protein